MHFTSLAVFGLCATSALVSATPLQTRDVLEDLQNQALAALRDATDNGLAKKSCSIFNAKIRKDWALLSATERKSYTSAVNCLMKKPSRSDPAVVPGAKSRYDDFVAQHINQTLSIHGTGSFLSWHRYFVWSYETALREECGYTGYQPYWNWLSYQNNPTKSPVFDGSATSMSGDGSFVAHNGSVGGAGAIFLPSGNGGGCITSGPFKDMTVNLGPVSPTMAGETKVNSSFAYNPRCLKRDLSAYTATTWLTATNLLNLTIGNAAQSIETFQNELQGRFSQGFLGMHAAGHFMIGGDAGDLFSSPVDPAFWLHHAMLDRVWWLWQALHLNQAETIAGTVTIFNKPPSRNATLDDVIYMGQSNAPTRPIKELLNSLGDDPFCYIYL
ncbi:hypothetical protein JX265_012284 [Neoarthrinium moseri]|uniref:Tyrosinase copper-binding domain-containing protein n=1 Tax=Neoarthrinium moseri TaxID=1658444 RepID=A0A9P9WAG9_9PEZI|nr:uncharacterized protein JN550_004401 [Neoarthrinium moseri]KAI1849818.1 hypothetical protein JX266_004767 [Neoarthrinium moseri]KAI1855096.1 hypothetical protein JX265_012284 [Neoarthrinium moseri]KAI1871407.1 hypothetical protein JN550_004401 [Neoarthrinium moseri]